jgi:GntR family transcriptional regulator
MHIKVDQSSAIPYYHQIKEAVKALIASGRLKAGEMLPSEVSLSEQLGVSRLVVHRAFRELVTEGLLIRKRPKGTFVAPRVHRGYRVVGPLFSMTENLAQDGMRSTNRILKQEVITADQEVQAGLGLAGRARVVHLNNLRLADGLPFAVEDMYFSAERFSALAGMDLNNRSVYSVLEQDFDAHPQEAQDTVTAGPASHKEARLLGITTGAPVMRLRRTSTDRRGRPVEYSKVVFHAERYQFVARVRREA